jgi:hypothetical protein
MIRENKSIFIDQFYTYLCYISFVDKPHFLGFIIKQSIMTKGTYISENLTRSQMDVLFITATMSGQE